MSQVTNVIVNFHWAKACSVDFKPELIKLKILKTDYKYTYLYTVCQTLSPNDYAQIIFCNQVSICID